MRTRLYKYREKPLTFHSNFDKEDIERAEEVIVKNGYYNSRDILEKVISLLFGITLNDNEFERTFSASNVVASEEYIAREMEVNLLTAQDILKDICYALVDLELYDEEYDDEGKIIEDIHPAIKKAMEAMNNKSIYVISVRERFNYGDDSTFYYTDDYDKALEWVKDEYPDAEEDGTDVWNDNEADVTISIELATAI